VSFKAGIKHCTETRNGDFEFLVWSFPGQPQQLHITDMQAVGHEGYIQMPVAQATALYHFLARVLDV
jgi:hypothetical protein